MPLRDMRILVVDDEPSANAAVGRLLRADGAAVRTTTSARIALDLVTEERPDVVVTDLDLVTEERPDVVVTDLAMPEMDGVSLIDALCLLQIPSIVVTGTQGVDRAVAAMKAGASDYLTKPIDGEALVAALARVKRSPRQELLAREHLLSVVAHDLRAPLSIIALAASAGEAALDVPHRLDMIRRAATRMTKLVEDLLDVSRLETGSLALDLSPRRTREILDGVEEAVGPIAEANGVHLECESEDELEVQVLVNLASNAVSVTPSGRRVVVRAMRRGGRARFEVEDEGPGIAHEHLPRIFERGFRLDTGRRRGAGLGLTIARGIVEAHGGSPARAAPRGA